MRAPETGGQDSAERSEDEALAVAADMPTSWPIAGAPNIAPKVSPAVPCVGGA
jgi:hypothetical protein